VDLIPVWYQTSLTFYLTKNSGPCLTNPTSLGLALKALWEVKPLFISDCVAVSCKISDSIAKIVVTSFQLPSLIANNQRVVAEKK
jgi:hypothetical protein